MLPGSGFHSGLHKYVNTGQVPFYKVSTTKDGFSNPLCPWDWRTGMSTLLSFAAVTGSRISMPGPGWRPWPMTAGFLYSRNVIPESGMRSAWLFWNMTTFCQSALKA